MLCGTISFKGVKARVKTFLGLDKKEEEEAPVPLQALTISEPFNFVHESVAIPDQYLGELIDLRAKAAGHGDAKDSAQKATTSVPASEATTSTPAIPDLKITPASD
ncbi:hypothetical protein F5Y16DRAFT_403987 [Xylariaceae sp. FL0255]|nr:hypothetical protein F5Y16DRAFT_403987 [Xylariaceae sp. FL0255]